MPRPSKLSDQDKADVAYLYQMTDHTQEDLANKYNVHRRTIQRALEEKGVVRYRSKKPRVVTEDEEAILHEAKRHGLKPTTFKQLLQSYRYPDAKAVIRFLSNTSSESFDSILSIVGYKRLQRQSDQIMHQKQRAANE